MVDVVYLEEFLDYLESSGIDVSAINIVEGNIEHECEKSAKGS